MDELFALRCNPAGQDYSRKHVKDRSLLVVNGHCQLIQHE